MMNLLKKTLFVSGLVMLTSCANLKPGEVYDPLEPLNRFSYQVNNLADKFILQPVARGYRFVTPNFAQTGTGNFLSNIDEPRTVINDLLQAKPKQAGMALLRFLTNTVLGLGGVVDVATDLGLPRHREDFGQTLGYWGMGGGPYLMLPLLGPSTIRDFTGRLVDTPLNPTFYYQNDDSLLLNITMLDVIHLRSTLLQAQAIINEQDDPYAFIRNAYIQRRINDIYDGRPPEIELDEELIE